MLSGTCNFAIRQNSTHGGTLIAQFYSSTKECTFYGDCSIPLFIISHLSIPSFHMSRMIFILKQIGALFPNTDLSNYYTKTEIGDVDNELPTLILNTYNKSEIDTRFTDYYNIEYLNIKFGLTRKLKCLHKKRGR